MSDIADPRWPLEAHPRHDEAQAYRRRVAERALAQLEQAAWRPEVVLRASELFDQLRSASPDGEDFSPQSIADTFLAANLIPTADIALFAPANGPAFGALIGEAASLFLFRHTDRIAWSLVRQVLFDFDGMMVSLRTHLHSLVQKDPSFRERFNALTDTIFADNYHDPALSTRGKETETFLPLLENWRKVPRLRSIWAGLPEMRHPYLTSDVGVLAYIYVILDAGRLAQLLDNFDNPYQTWAVLAPFVGLGLESKFAVWADMFAHAAPSFSNDGSWNGNSLEPLLLVVAQDALRQARLPQDAADDVVATRQREFNALTEEISKLLAKKTSGSALALRWSAWLFWLSNGGKNDQSNPQDLRHPTFAFWGMLEAIARSDVAKDWNGIEVPDAFSEEVLCLLAVKIVAADERRSALPSAEPIYQCLPDAPENFLGERGRRTREISRMFSIYGEARPDGLKYRVLAVLFFQGDPVLLYSDLWRRTLVLRELAEHWQTGEQDDGRMDAKNVLTIVLAIGLCIIDRNADPRAKTEQIRDEIQFGQLFGLIYDSLREIQAIELFNQPLWSSFYTHLLVRRALYENRHVGTIDITAPLLPDTEPTMSTMLSNIAGVTQLFFDGLNSLVRNKVPSERIALAIQSAGIDLTGLLSSARTLNNLDERKLFRIEAVTEIETHMKEVNTK
jgi:hypothetical protein